MSLPSLPRPLVFVLSGGGAYGAGQLGQLRALAEAGLEPDRVVGTSVGALHGALLARSGTAAVDLLDTIWADLDRRTVFGPVRSIVGNLARTRRPASAARLLALIDEIVGCERVADLERPFAAVATDLGSGAAVTLCDGRLADVLAASAAIPGVFPPVTIEGRRLIDGGVAANLPIRQALDLGAGSIVALDVTPSGVTGDAGSGWFAGVLQAGAIMLRSQHAHLLDADLEVPIVVLPSPSPADAGLFAFARWEEFRDLGYRSARNVLQG